MSDPAPALLEHALGCLFGASCGDAAGTELCDLELELRRLGAVLEFIGHKPTETEVRWALTMPGGGVLFDLNRDFD